MIQTVGYLALSVLMLSSCTTLSPSPLNASLRNKDIASYSVTADDVVTPTAPSNSVQVLPLSRYGNALSYQVKGKLYNLLTKPEGYQAQGIASWYGEPFHKQRTSSGEIYDMHALTAAHKTLPIPSYLSVTNLENNRQVVVKVNDRGPFHQGRIIDLSFAAAKQLGFERKGTARVKITLLNHAKQSSSGLAQFLQVAAFKRKNLAESFANSLRSWIEEPIATDLKHQMYLVRIGPLKDTSASQQLTKALALRGIKPVFSYVQ